MMDLDSIEKGMKIYRTGIAVADTTLTEDEGIHCYPYEDLHVSFKLSAADTFKFKLKAWEPILGAWITMHDFPEETLTEDTEFILKTYGQKVAVFMSVVPAGKSVERICIGGY